MAGSGVMMSSKRKAMEACAGVEDGMVLVSRE